MAGARDGSRGRSSVWRLNRYVTINDANAQRTRLERLSSRSGYCFDHFRFWDRRIVARLSQTSWDF